MVLSELGGWGWVVWAELGGSGGCYGLGWVVLARLGGMVGDMGWGGWYGQDKTDRGSYLTRHPNHPFLGYFRI